MCLNNNIIAFGVRYNNHPIQRKYVGIQQYTYNILQQQLDKMGWRKAHTIYSNNKKREKVGKERAPESSLFICMHNGLFII